MSFFLAHNCRELINDKISFIKAFVSVTCLQLHTIRHILDTSLGYWCLDLLSRNFYINIFRGGSSRDEIYMSLFSIIGSRDASNMMVGVLTAKE